MELNLAVCKYKIWKKQKKQKNKSKEPPPKKDIQGMHLFLIE